MKRKKGILCLSERVYGLDTSVQIQNSLSKTQTTKQRNKKHFFGFLLCVRNKQCLKCFTSAHSLILTFLALEYNVSTRSHFILLDRMATGRHSINGYRISMAQSQYFTWRLVPTLLSSVVFKTIALPLFSDSHEPHSLVFIPFFFFIYRNDLILIFWN